MGRPSSHQYRMDMSRPAMLHAVPASTTAATTMDQARTGPKGFGFFILAASSVQVTKDRRATITQTR